MSLTSWFFGKKKSPEEPIQNSGPSDPQDDFLFIERKNPVYPRLSGDDLPYPVVSPNVSPAAPSNDAINSLENNQASGHPLNDVPFQMNGQLLFTEQRLEQDEKECREVKRVIKELESWFNYNFDMERAVLNEIDSQNTE